MHWRRERPGLTDPDLAAVGNGPSAQCGGRQPTSGPAAMDVEEAGVANDVNISVVGFVATQPRGGHTKTGSRSVTMRVGWTPRAMDRTTGEWTDQPSSFITVQCYKKVAEHAAVCLRRGDPIIVRGTLRIREFVDQAGNRRSAVEVIADSIGHDMSRGISLFTKATASVERTAAEHEQQLAAEAGRDPLPGDRDAIAAAERAGRRGHATAGADDDEQAATGDAAEDEMGEQESGGGYGVMLAGSTDEPDGDIVAGRSFDDAVRDMIAEAQDGSVPASASA
jgi:single-strand DNA-binding protein